ncbi:MAG: hypothetical protein ACE5J3_12250 [Methanosarcinales archaeon]
MQKKTDPSYIYGGISCFGYFVVVVGLKFQMDNDGWRRNNEVIGLLDAKTQISNTNISY